MGCALLLGGRIEIEAAGRRPLVEQFNQPGAFAHADLAPAAGIERRHRGPGAAFGPTALVELGEGVAALKRTAKPPAAFGWIGLHDFQLDAGAQLAQAPHQPGPVGPGATATHDQHVGARLAGIAWQRGQLQEGPWGSAVVAVLVCGAEPTHQLLPLPLPEAAGRAHQSSRRSHGKGQAVV